MQETKQVSINQVQIISSPKDYKHFFYMDTFSPCDKCPVLDSCPNARKLKDHRNRDRCIEEKNFFDETLEKIKFDFQLDEKDLFQLPQMITTMIKLKRMDRYVAEQGPIGQTLLFNPKTGEEHWMATSNVINRDMYYTHKNLQGWLQSLRLSRESRDAKEGIDVFSKMLSTK